MPSLRYLVLVPDWILVLVCFLLIASALSCALLYALSRAQARRAELLRADYRELRREHFARRERHAELSEKYVRLQKAHDNLKIEHRELVEELAQSIPDDLCDASADEK